MSKKGYVMTEEHKRKIGLAVSRVQKGKKQTPEHTRNIRRGMMGHKVSDETKEKLSQVNGGKSHPWHRGEKHYNWKGGVTPQNKTIRHSVEYKLWRTAVFERDNYTCIWCGAKSASGVSVTLNADHIKPFCDYPELRLAIDNGRTLCVDCHKTTDTYTKRRKQ